MIYGDINSASQPGVSRYTEAQRIGFTTSMLSDRICTISKSRGRLLSFGEEATLQGVWANLSSYTLRYLATINEIVRKGPKSKETAYWHIYMLLIQDRAVRGSVWAAHMKGYLAYIECMGGIKAVLKRNEQPRILKTVFTFVNPTFSSPPSFFWANHGLTVWMAHAGKW